MYKLKMFVSQGGESAFLANGNLNSSFKELDEERFYIRVYDPEVSSGNVMVTVESFARGSDPLIDPAIDQQNDVILMPQGNSIFKSGSCLLVTDNDSVDDDFDNPPSPNGALDGTDDAGDDPTIYAVQGGKLKMTYTPVIGSPFNKIIDICDILPNPNPAPPITEIVKAKVRLNIISMDDGNGSFYFTDAEIMTEIGQLNKGWGQCCIRFVNSAGNEIMTTDISHQSPPSTVDLTNGLETNTSIVNSNFDLDAEEKALLDEVKDEDDSTIDIIFLGEVVINGQPSGIRGYSLNEFLAANTQMNAVYQNTVVITNMTEYFTTPHEIGHVITNLGHYGNDINNGEYNYIDDYILPFERNLMRAGGTSSFNGVGTSKRLVGQQCLDALNNTSLLEPEQ